MVQFFASRFVGASVSWIYWWVHNLLGSTNISPRHGASVMHSHADGIFLRMVMDDGIERV